MFVGRQFSRRYARRTCTLAICYCLNSCNIDKRSLLPRSGISSSIAQLLDFFYLPHGSVNLEIVYACDSSPAKTENTVPIKGASSSDFSEISWEINQIGRELNIFRVNYIFLGRTGSRFKGLRLQRTGRTGRTGTLG